MTDAEHLAELRRLVAAQGEDPALWFVGPERTAPEAYLQAALRRLHRAIERPDLYRAATPAGAQA